MAKLPSAIRVGTRVYTVQATVDALNKMVRSTGEDIYGATDHPTQRIVLDPEAAPDRKAETFLHEVLHCVTEYCGIATEMGSKTEEKLVRRLAPVLLGVIQDNPSFIGYLKSPS